MTDVSDQQLLGDLFRQLSRAGALSEAEREALADAVVTVRTYPARAMIVPAHVDQQDSKLLLDGFVSRQNELADGRRQILAIHVPGDFVDLHGLLLRRLDHEVVALTPARMAIMSHVALRRITVDHPRLARMLWFLTAVDAAIHREWIASLGRPAAQRIAHLMCELHCRLEIVNRADRTGYALPLTQADLADATALTPVHVNRTLRNLRERGLVDFRGGRVEILNLRDLCRLAGFDGDYLYLDRGEI